MKIFVGVDPGLSGALAVIDQTGMFVGVYDIPTFRQHGYNAINVERLREFLQPYRKAATMVEIQASRPGGGVRATFTTGFNYGRLTATLDMLGIAWDIVRPAVWKKWAGVTKDKETSLKAARERWPEAPLSRTKDHDRAEALLIAEYGRRHA